MLVVNKAIDAKHAFAELTRALRKGSKAFNRVVGWPNGHGHYTVYWHEAHGFWFLTRPDVNTRFWRAYGTQNPEKHKYLNISCEINPPKAGENRRCAGAFLRDSSNALYLAHSGRVGGGRKGVGRQSFSQFYAGPTQSVTWRDGTATSLYNIGKVSSPSFLSGLAKFIRKVDEFKLDNRSVDQLLDEDAQKAEREGDYDPQNVKQGREKTLRAINLRRGQPEFRRKLLNAYGSRCAISGYDCEYALEAAHIQPYGGSETNHVQNGILLRSDLHVLFDLGKISIHPSSRRVVIAKSLLNTIYGRLNGKRVRRPIHSSQLPNAAVLKEHWDKMEH